jgi:hypothetical protein
VFFEQLAVRKPFTPPGEMIERITLGAEEFDVYLV